MKKSFTVRAAKALWPAAVFFLLSCTSEPKEVTILFTGDLLLDRGVREQIERKGADHLFDKVAPVLKQADFVYANLECPVTTIVSPINKRFIFRGEPEWLETLYKNGITHLNMANNHANDQGREAISATAENIVKYGMIATGYGISQQEACQPVIITKNKVTVAVFQSLQLPQENWVYLSDAPDVCQATGEELAQKVAHHKKNHPDHHVVVVLHWGIEYHPTPTPTQVKQAHTLIDHGADAIIGHHPHVVQTVSTYKGKPIFYSLGNFIFDQQRPGLLAQLTFSTNSDPRFEKIPIHIDACRPEIKKE